MRFATPLVPGRLKRRYMRFLSDVMLDTSEDVKAHCPNPGSMLGLNAPGTRVWLERNDDPRKKLDWGWRLAELDGGFVTIDTSLANRVVGEALRAGAVPALAGAGAVRAEVKFGTGSRVDFCLGGDTFVEVKSVTLARRPGLAEFPDSVTKRGTKHLHELAEVARMGRRAVMFYLVQRTDCVDMSLAADIDPDYASAFEDARAAGVEVICHRAAITPEAIELGPACTFHGPNSAK
ncbi:MAG: DNA/RNA nuclease SfsA [Salibaculum sp.]|jgi:sugar fermentation stimulation protein A|uniref:DNA/RNA nuclease SfsA n=1 Tax=Salibaculum sp. TaxID=2855480 RepID=UPI00287069BB|nr:DNA/RNA nuclease SfsA [Salibaculum sp.]MDR9426884.1 DNA/RNA nuclease SfsA [Salibaculum sp.]MDR9481437.1 DNA/RNA nuclease SfsA [Salibaculum sp.]